MSKTTIKTKANSVFLATVLVAGIIALSYPSFMIGAQAQEFNGMDQKYNSYETDYGTDYGMNSYDKKPYGKDNSYDKSKDSNIKCNNINANLNGFNDNEVGALPSGLKALVTQAQAEDEGANGANSGNDRRGGDDDRSSGHDSNSRFICINNNDNILPSPTPPTTPPPDPGTCEAPIDLVIVLDDTGSMGGTIANLQAEFNTIISQAETASEGDLQVGFITFKDDVTVVNDLTTDIDAVRTSINAASAGGGNNEPEASDIAKNTAVDLTTYRAEALKIVILITDASAGGDNDINEPADEANMLAAATEAATKGIKVSDIFVPTAGSKPVTEANLQQDATISGGQYASVNADGTGTAEAISDIIVGCGEE